LHRERFSFSDEQVSAAADRVIVRREVFLTEGNLGGTVHYASHVVFNCMVFLFFK